MNNVRDIVNDGIGDVHKDSAEIADQWVREYDTHPHKPFNGTTGDTRSLPANHGE